jgi:hypothetical protein
MYTHQTMDLLRRQGDPLADTTVETLFERGEVEKFNTLMRWFTESGQEPPDGMPEAARHYLEETAAPPTWIDWEIMERARLFFIDNNVHISTALAFASMPLSYAIPHVAKLLSATHSLEYPARRMSETGQFVVYLMRTDAFEAKSRFVPAVQKVRLLHASVRHHLRREGRWNEATAGVPLCQEDMIGGQMCFSICVLDALHRLGIHFSEDDAEAYFYAWRVVGAMLGCATEQSPADLTAAREWSDLYLLRNLGPSEEGVKLTEQLISLYEGVVPSTFFDPVVAALIRFLVGDTIADWLQVPASAWDRVARASPLMFDFLERIENSGPWGEWVADKAGAVVANLELSSLTRGRVMHYAIPPQLKKDYGVRTPRRQRWQPPPPSTHILRQPVRGGGTG